MSRAVVSLLYGRKVGKGIHPETGKGVTALIRKAVLTEMADRASDDGSMIFVSKGRIAREIEASKTAVKDAVASLLNDGILFEDGHRKCKAGWTVVYGIDLDVVAKLPKSLPDGQDIDDPGHIRPQSPGDPLTATEPGRHAPPRGSPGDPHPGRRATPNRPITVLEQGAGAPRADEPRGAAALAASSQGRKAYAVAQAAATQECSVSIADWCDLKNAITGWCDTEGLLLADDYRAPEVMIAIIETANEAAHAAKARAVVA